jgi:hypothetical protein
VRQVMSAAADGMVFAGVRRSLMTPQNQGVWTSSYLVGLLRYPPTRPWASSTTLAPLGDPGLLEVSTLCPLQVLQLDSCTLAQPLPPSLPLPCPHPPTVYPLPDSSLISGLSSLLAAQQAGQEARRSNTRSSMRMSSCRGVDAQRTVGATQTTVVDMQLS